MMPVPVIRLFFFALVTMTKASMAEVMLEPDCIPPDASVGTVITCITDSGAVYWKGAGGSALYNIHNLGYPQSVTTYSLNAERLSPADISPVNINSTAIITKSSLGPLRCMDNIVTESSGMDLLFRQPTLLVPSLILSGVWPGFTLNVTVGNELSSSGSDSDSDPLTPIFFSIISQKENGENVFSIHDSLLYGGSSEFEGVPLDGVSIYDQELKYHFHETCRQGGSPIASYPGTLKLPSLPDMHLTWIQAPYITRNAGEMKTGWKIIIDQVALPDKENRNTQSRLELRFKGEQASNAQSFSVGTKEQSLSFSSLSPGDYELDLFYCEDSSCITSYHRPVIGRVLPEDDYPAVKVNICQAGSGCQEPEVTFFLSKTKQGVLELTSKYGTHKVATLTKTLSLPVNYTNYTYNWHLTSDGEERAEAEITGNFQIDTWASTTPSGTEASIAPTSAPPSGASVLKSLPILVGIVLFLHITLNPL